MLEDINNSSMRIKELKTLKLELNNLYQQQEEFNAKEGIVKRTDDVLN